MNKILKKILLSTILYILFSIVLFCITAFTSGLRNTNDDLIILFAVSLLRIILSLTAIGICIWLVYKLWYSKGNKTKVFVLTAVLSTIIMYVLWFIFVIICLALEASGGF